jgi:hypothetical protein
MNSKILIRIAAGCILFFAIGHSLGHGGRYDVVEPKAKVVVQMMKDVKFDLFGQQRSYDENYTGMSLNLIFTLLVFTVLLWVISGLSVDHKKVSVNLLLPINICIAGFAVTSFLFFFPVPAITCLLAFLLITISIIQLSKR